MTKKKSILLTILGTMTTGFGIGAFLTPNKIVGGGASGLSTILYHTFAIPPGISFFALNILFLLVGFKVLGKDFVFKTLFGSLVLSVFVEIFCLFPIYTENLILATIFGGVLYGIGIGLSFAAGASTGGTDVVGRIIQNWLPHFPIGKLLLATDGVIILTSLLIFKNVELVLYGIIALFFSSFTIDFVIGKLNVSRLAFVVTECGGEIANKLVSTSPRGVTLIDVMGGLYPRTQADVILCLKGK